MRAGYIVSRFPHVSETFIVREMDALARRPGIEIELFSLFPAHSTTVHRLAEPWVPRLRRPGLAAGLAASLGWLARRPLRFLSSLAVVATSYARSPGHLVRALATVPIAAAHARDMRSLRLDHLHAHYATYPALAAWLAWRLTGISYSFTAHAHDLYVDQSMLARKVADAAYVVTISEFNRAVLEPYGGGTATPVEVVHCGIDTSAYDGALSAPPASGPVRALCVASLQEYKGHRFLLDAVAQPGLERIALDLVGDGELRDALEQQAARLGLGERVSFRGALEESEVAALLDQADLFVLPSIVAADGQMEGLPVALMEALAAGVPVVSTRLSGIPELVRDGETGVLAEPGDAQSLAAALRRVVDDPRAAERSAQAGRELVRREFTLQRTADQLASLLER